MSVTVRVRPALQLKTNIMEEVNKEMYKLSKEIDAVYVLELVKKFPNDAELGSEIRSYVRNMTEEK